jgi:hypothetical protein
MALKQLQIELQMLCQKINWNLFAQHIYKVDIVLWETNKLKNRKKMLSVHSSSHKTEKASAH